MLPNLGMPSPKDETSTQGLVWSGSGSMSATLQASRSVNVGSSARISRTRNVRRSASIDRSARLISRLSSSSNPLVSPRTKSSE
eukprot:scaffold52245_cov32-Tisochrysis_lutea.AAC.3